MRKRKGSLYILGLLALAGLAAVMAPACKAKAPASAENITLEAVVAVMGRASGSSSGVSELTKSGDSYTINYHLMLPSQNDFDTLIGSDLAPKIEQLYKTFKTLDNVTFTVETGDISNPANVQPYCSFDMTRRIYNQLNWTNLLARDLFKVCKVKYQ
jgi:hypothetical protein